MKKILAIAIILSLFAGLAFAQKAQWDNAKKQYTIEKNAKIVIGLDNDIWGNAFVEYWNKKHPEAKGMVEYNNFGCAGAADQISAVQGDAPDILLAIDGEVGRNVQSLLLLDSVLAGVGKNNTPAIFFNNTNVGGQVKFIPIAYDGMAFAYNETMMKSLKLDTTDKNKDGLPDAFDTWEKIFELSKSWTKERPVYKKQKINIVYPISIEEVWSGYSSLTTGGWQIFKEGDPTKPGFEKPEFLKGLEFIKAASDAMICVEANGSKTPGASAISSRFQEFLEAQTAVFGLVGTWMDVNSAEKKGGANFRFAPMPTWNGNRPSPFVKTKGFVINAFTKFPSAAHEVMRLLYTKEAMQLMIDNSSYIPAVNAKSSIAPNFKEDPNKSEMSAAFAFNYPEPSMTLPKNRFRKGMDVYYNINVNLALRDIWDGVKTPAQAQADLVDLSTKWLAENNK